MMKSNSSGPFCYPYPRMAHTVDAILVAEDDSVPSILLIQRRFEPYQGCWALPGGFVNMEETLLEACQRELFEETGLSQIPLDQFFTFDAIDRDPRHRTISTIFVGRLSSKALVEAGDDASQAQWFPIDQLPELAFDHKAILDKYLDHSSH